MIHDEQIEVRAAQAVQVHSDDVSGLYTCYLCDTDVPKTHMRIHIEGDKHQTCLQIADVALERARRQMTLEIQPEYNLDPHTYYCDPCSDVLLTCERKQHEESECHIESVQYYSVLKTFSTFYTNRETTYSLKESDPIYTTSAESTDEPIHVSMENSKETELKAILKHLKDATDHMQCPGESLAEQDPNLNKALLSLKKSVDRTLNELQETVSRKESVFNKAIHSLKKSAEKTLEELKESADSKRHTDIERSKLSEEAELEISKFKNQLSEINVVRKNKKNTNLSKPMSCFCDDNPKNRKVSSIREKMKATFGSLSKDKSKDK